ncbi:MAG: type II CAAX endopeptidase family protein [Planctomycetota bacterium]
MATVLGLGAVAIDLTVMVDPVLGSHWIRPLMGAVVLVAFVALGGGRAALGLRLVPLPGLRPWRRVMVAWAGVGVAMIGLVSLASWWNGTPLVSPFRREEEIAWFARSCLEAPITEELLYRVAVCAPLAAALGRRWTFALSGVLFAYLHFRWNKYQPTHLVTGAVYAWAYLRSSCVWVPIAMHAIGNVLGLTLFIVLFYCGLRVS